MTPEEFIDVKAPQLAHYGKAFLSDKLEFNEVRLYLWDTLEEWHQLNLQGEAQTDVERVFWHLLYAFDKWPDWVLRGNQFLRQQLDDCCEYLFGGGPIPEGCIGVRP
ncbi:MULTISPECIES: hypothetical protein [Shewanella]|jgi:hypothetical protein|uniref:Uncharacterized protein n=5 Tax=Bacteria TaxID=2 RepID=A0A1S2TZZ0_9GAMM|nr:MULTISPECIES: hypothetical protein [Shewanella]AYV14789.1 hypothetical protein EEY24_19090 [Shewanella algae]EKT4489560.1 hypothetical protein [Shewanella algae]MBC8794302.1 hypothetical protein [Shewanella algae]MBO2548960.1 hypothetical protein [Shewanella algae]MBO2553579.1 hypothetical protein [Shewanella algae]